MTFDDKTRQDTKKPLNCGKNHNIDFLLESVVYNDKLTLSPVSRSSYHGDRDTHVSFNKTE